MKKSFILIINVKSGHDEKADLISSIEQKISETGHTLEIVKIDDPEDMSALAKQTVISAKEKNAIIVAAGGDGSINAIAQHCHKHKVPMGIIPLGTFNFFARDLGIPTDTDEAIDLLLTGETYPTAIGTVGNMVFLVHVGLGLYSDIIRNRERDKSRFGRYRIVAMLSSFVTLIQARRIKPIIIKTDNTSIHRQALNLFVGNNQLQLENLGLINENEIPADELSGIILKPMSSWQRVSLAFWGILRSMKMNSRIETFHSSAFIVETPQDHINAAIDGELVRLETPLHFQCIPDGLQVIRPARQRVP